MLTGFLWFNRQIKPPCIALLLVLASPKIPRPKLFSTAITQSTISPAAKKFIRPLMGSEELFCLWLVEVSPAEIKKIPPIYERVKNVRDFRVKSNRAGTRKGADTPQCFLEIRQPNSDFILIPKVSSENRLYIPIGFMDKNFIAVNTVLIIPNAGLYEFGILTSLIHNAWMRTVGGRLNLVQHCRCRRILHSLFTCTQCKFTIKCLSRKKIFFLEMM